MPRCFLHSVRGYKHKHFWGCEADSKNVMLTRSGLVIRTPAIHSSNKRSIRNSPSELEQNAKILQRTNGTQKTNVDQSIDEMSIVTRYHLFQHAKNDTSNLDQENFFRVPSVWPDESETLHSCGTNKSSRNDMVAEKNVLKVLTQKNSTNPQNITAQRIIPTEQDRLLHAYSAPVSRIPKTLTGLIVNKTPESISTNQYMSGPEIFGAQFKFSSLKEATDAASAAESLVAMATGSKDPNVGFQMATSQLPSDHLLLQSSKPDCKGMIVHDIGIGQAAGQMPRVLHCDQINNNIVGLQQRDSIKPIRVRLVPDIKPNPIQSLKGIKRDQIRYIAPASHSYAIDANGNHVHKCTVCGKIFTVLEAFLSHASSHHKSKNSCEICGKTFSRSWLLKGHMRTHTGERPYVCKFPGCQKAFADKSNLRSHSLIHTSNGKSHVCSRCNRAFAQRRYLHKHLLEVCKA